MELYSEESEFTLAHGRAFLDDLRQSYRVIQGVDIYFDPESNEWTLCHQGVTYVSRRWQTGDHWFSPETGEIFSLIVMGDEIFFCPEIVLQMRTRLWKAQAHRAEQVLTVDDSTCGPTRLWAHDKRLKH